MGGDGLSLTGLADHEKLGQDGHRLQVDGERPQNLGQTKGKTGCWWKNNASTDMYSLNSNTFAYVS